VEVAKFTYDRGRGLDKNVEGAKKSISETDKKMEGGIPPSSSSKIVDSGECCGRDNSPKGVQGESSESVQGESTEEDLDVSRRQGTTPEQSAEHTAKPEASSSPSSTDQTGPKAPVSGTATPQVSSGHPEELTSATISPKIAGYTQQIAEYIKQPIPFNTMGGSLQEIHTFLKDTENFVRQNDLTEEETLILKQGLRKLCNTPIIDCSNGNSHSINECDQINLRCRNIALQAESLEMLLDAKACGQVGLERNVPPAVKVLGSGAFNTVSLAHTKPGVDGEAASGSIVLKPCDQSKSEKDLDEFLRGAEVVRDDIGPATGSYRRNKATAGVQDMLCAIGREKEIDIPHVIATISAAEINGVPCIAMEMLAGKTVGHNARHGRIRNNSEFVRRETWIQVQDVLTGQIDRHGDNVMLTGDGPIAFDHDLSFPTDPPRNFADKIPLRLVSTVRTLLGPKEVAIDCKPGTLRNYCMPPVIDREMYDVIMAIDLPALESMYEECGLTRLEIGAAMARAEGLQMAARQLMEVDRVIEPNQWRNSPPVREHCNAQNFYAFRHLDGG
jgi:hypothetical protein